jgi:hypothetical protein
METDERNCFRFSCCAVIANGGEIGPAEVYVSCIEREGEFQIRLQKNDSFQTVTSFTIFPPTLLAVNLSSSDGIDKLFVATSLFQVLVLTCKSMSIGLMKLKSNLLQNYSCNLDEPDKNSLSPPEYAPEQIIPPGWRISHINRHYSLCPSYPSELIVPDGIPDSVIRHAAAFRTRGRLPVLAWSIKNTNDGIVSHIPVCRSSQPCVGIAGRRSVQDEALLDMIRRASMHTSNEIPNDPFTDYTGILEEYDPQMLIMDARPLLSAAANTIYTGGGSMQVQHYRGCIQVFATIPNIHGLAQAFRQRVSLLASPHFDKPITEREAYKVHIFDADHNIIPLDEWSKCARAVLSAAKTVAEAAAIRGHSVLVHCTDGWDRTPQILSLAQIIADPEARTIKGLMQIIQTHWLDYGHPFALRGGSQLAIGAIFEESSYSDKRNPASQAAPVFPLFLASLGALIDHLPKAFEYTNEILFEIWVEVAIAQRLEGVDSVFSRNTRAERGCNQRLDFSRILSKCQSNGAYQSFKYMLPF